MKSNSGVDMRGRKLSRVADPRHADIKRLLDRYWEAECPMIPSLPWGGADAGALGQFLRDNPSVTVELISNCLAFRLVSEDHAPGERVYVWIRDVLRYASGPLNKFKQPKIASPEASAGAHRPGKRYGSDEAQRPLREVMSAEWQDRAIRLHREGSPELGDLEKQFLKEEKLI